MCLLFFFSTMMWRLGLAWVRGVYGAAERRLAAPAVVGDSAWLLTQNSGFGLHDDGRRNRAPLLNFAISLVFCEAGHQIKAAAICPLSLIATR